MAHPEHAAVGLLTLALVAAGTLLAVAVGMALWLYSDRVFHLRRSRAVYWVGVAVLAPIVVASVPLAAAASKAVAVVGFAGWDAYSNGLRVISKHGQLSDGRYLSVFWAAVLGAVLWTTLVLIAGVASAWHLHFHPPRVSGRAGGNSWPRDTW